MTLRKLTRLAPVFSALALAACSGGKSSAPAAKKDGPVVAKVGSDVITADEVKAKLAEQSPFLQARYKDFSHKKEFVQNMVRFEVLAQEAYKRGLDKQPEVQATLKKVLVQELIRQEFDEKKATFSDAELKSYYDKHIDEFVKPERIRSQMIFVAGPASDKAARAKAKAKANELLAQIKENDARASDKHPKHAAYVATLFSDLARKESNDAATQATGGDLRYLTLAELTKNYSEVFAKAVFALQDANQLTGVVEDENGFRLGRLTNRQLAVNRSFDEAQVKETIKGRIFREQRTKSFDEYVEKLKKDANVEINEENLKAVEVSGAVPPPGGMPNMVPPPQAPTAVQK
jgi:peptidyl-prolyl cis-trans isomerase C